MILSLNLFGHEVVSLAVSLGGTEHETEYVDNTGGDFPFGFISDEDE